MRNQKEKGLIENAKMKSMRKIKSHLHLTSLLSEENFWYVNGTLDVYDCLYYKGNKIVLERDELEALL